MMGVGVGGRRRRGEVGWSMMKWIRRRFRSDRVSRDILAIWQRRDRSSRSDATRDLLPVGESGGRGPK